MIAPIAVLAGLLIALHTSAQLPSEFDEYRAEAALHAAPRAPRLDTARARKYRTVLREEASLGANFNGHYRVVHWGCGTNCIEWAILDLVKGTVLLAKQPVFSCAGARVDERGTAVDWFGMSVHSSLLYVHSCRQDRGLIFDTRHVYHFRQGRLILLRVDRFPLAPPVQ